MPEAISTSAPGAQTEFIPAVQIARALLEAKLTDQPVTYGAVYRGIVSGAIPAEQTANGRWRVRKVCLPEVAAALGLRAPTAQAAA